MPIKLKRVYDKVEESDGYRVLVERLWPRGIRKDEAVIGEWIKEIAPSGQLRKWYSHDISKWLEFKQRYYIELSNKEDLVRLLIEKASTSTLTFVYAARDLEHNSAIALKEYIDDKMTTIIHKA